MYNVDLHCNAVCLDSSLSTKAQNDKVLESCNNAPLVILSVAKYPNIKAWNCKVMRFVWILFYAFLDSSVASLPQNDKENYRMTKNTPLRMTGKDTLKRQRNTLLSMTENKES